MKVKVFLLLCISYTLPVELKKKYDLLIIPVPKGSLQSIVNLQKEQRPKRPFYYRDGDKLDIENYEEPAEQPHVDLFDYNIERNKELTRQNYGVAREGDREEEEIYGEDKIVGGDTVDINLYPYHVAYGTNCGGAIIDRKWVMTAGHCGKKPYVRVGSKYMYEGLKVNVKRSVIHPLWDSKSKDHPFDYDFQLLELDTPLQFSDAVQPIKIAHIEDMVIGKVITVTGWGNTIENGPYSKVLRAVRVPIIAKDTCNKVPFPYFRGGLTARMFCAGYNEGKKDACQGDSGGPAVYQERLMGMVSFGYGCATPGSYGVYSKVAKVRDWIQEGIYFSILGGHSIDIEDAPYQVNYGDVCGGVLIHRRWVITSAHCGKQPFLRVGSTKRLGGRKLRIASYIVHPSYGKLHEFDYDIQLLELSRNLHFHQSVNAVSIGQGNKYLLVSGWGYTKEKGEYQNSLQQATIRMVSFSKCQSYNQSSYNHTLTERMFCAGGGTKDACQGDSGSGALSRGYLVGISIFGYGCGRHFPGVYLNVSEGSIRTWIRHVTGV